MSEATFYKAIRPRLKELGSFSRIESPITAEGFPDLDGVIDGVSNQVELKFIGHSTKTLKKEFFRLSQHVWFRDRLKCYEGRKGPFVFTHVQGLGYSIHMGDRILNLKEIRTKKEWVATSDFIWLPTPDSWRMFSKIFRNDLP